MRIGATARLVIKRSLWAVAYYFRVHPVLASVVVLITLATGFMPVAFLWTSKLLLDALTTYLQYGQTSDAFYQLSVLAGLQALLGFISLFLNQAYSYLSVRLSALMNFSLQQEIYCKFVRMDFRSFEDPVVLNSLYRMQNQSVQATGSLTVTVFALCRKLTTLFSSAFALLLFSPLLCVVAIMVSIPTVLLNSKVAAIAYALMINRTERMRREGYLGTIISSRSFARDNILYGLGQHFLVRWKAFRLLSIGEDVKIEQKKLAIESLVATINNAIGTGSYLYIASCAGAVGGTVGSVVMNAGLFANAQGQIQGLARDLSDLYRNAVLLNDYEDIMVLPSVIESQNEGIELQDLYSVRFDNVSFGYPGSSRQAVRNVSFEAFKGETVYLVGRNGTGKSTVLKLLLRLYDVDAGRILVNERDIREYSLSSLRAAFCVLMQDFSQYAFSLRENVVLGAIDRAGDEMRFREALEFAGLSEMARSLPREEATVLGRAFDDGEDLSLGEWQRIALARVRFRGASAIILDEPTSSLDAKIENEILARFHEAGNGRISFIVSHRLSNARLADRIIVFNAGEVVERGTHAELMAARGTYAELFQLQLSGYVE